MSRLRAALLLSCLPSLAAAGPWTRDRGRFFAALTYSRIAANGWYQIDFTRDRGAFDTQYVQHTLGFYGELGLVDRWLTVSLDGQPYRRTTLEGKGTTDGLGDFRLGFWSGLVTRPLRLTAAVLVGLPTGDPSPSGSPVARALPTGDGEADVEWRLSLGYSFGGARRWPFLHYLVAEAGYWLRTNDFSDAFTYRLELGLKLPWTFVDRFWIIARANGIESFISSADLAKVVVAPNPTGLSNGITIHVVGFELFARLWRGLGASFAIDLALRARLFPTAAAPRFSLTMEY